MEANKTIEVTGVAHLGIRVHSLERARHFYQRLGFEFVIGPVGPEPVAILKHPAGVEINLVLNSKDAESDNILMDFEHKYSGYTHVALAVRDLDQVCESLSSFEIPLSGGPNSYPGGARSVFVRDPDNNVVEFYQRADN